MFPALKPQNNPNHQKSQQNFAKNSKFKQKVWNQRFAASGGIPQYIPQTQNKIPKKSSIDRLQANKNRYLDQTNQGNNQMSKYQKFQNHSIGHSNSKNEDYDRELIRYDKKYWLRKKNQILNEVIQREIKNNKTQQNVNTDEKNIIKQLKQLDKIWHKQKIPDFYCYFFLQSININTANSAKTQDAINKQMRLLKNHESHYHQITKTISARQSCLSQILKCLQIMQNIVNSNSSNDQLQKKIQILSQQVLHYRKLTVYIIDKTNKWKQYLKQISRNIYNNKDKYQQKQTHPIFIYNQVNYLLKILNDTNFIAGYQCLNGLRFSTANDPFFLRPLKQQKNRQNALIYSIFEIDDEMKRKIMKALQILAEQKALQFRGRIHKPVQQPKKIQKQRSNSIKKRRLADLQSNQSISIIKKNVDTTQLKKSRIQQSSINEPLNQEYKSIQKQKQRIQRLQKNQLKINAIKSIYQSKKQLASINNDSTNDNYNVKSKNLLLKPLETINRSNSLAAKSKKNNMKINKQEQNQFQKILKQKKNEILKKNQNKIYPIEGLSGNKIDLLRQQQQKMRNTHQSATQRSPKQERKGVTVSTDPLKKKEDLINELKTQILQKLQKQAIEKQKLKKVKKIQEQKMIQQMKERLKKQLQQKLLQQKKKKQQQRVMLERRLKQQEERLKKYKDTENQIQTKIYQEKQLSGMQKLKLSILQKQKNRTNFNNGSTIEQINKLKLIQDLNRNNLKRNIQQQLKQQFRQKLQRESKIQDSNNKNPNELSQLQRQLKTLKIKQAMQLQQLKRQTNIKDKLLRQKIQQQQRKRMQLQNLMKITMQKQLQKMTKDKRKQIQNQLKQQKNIQNQLQNQKISKQKQEQIFRQKIKQKIQRQMRMQIIQKTQKQLQQKQINKRQISALLIQKGIQKTQQNNKYQIGGGMQKYIGQKRLQKQTAKNQLRNKFQKQLLINGLHNNNTSKNINNNSFVTKNLDLYRQQSYFNTKLLLEQQKTNLDNTQNLNLNNNQNSNIKTPNNLIMSSPNMFYSKIQQQQNKNIKNTQNQIKKSEFNYLKKNQQSQNQHNSPAGKYSFGLTSQLVSSPQKNKLGIFSQIASPLKKQTPYSQVNLPLETIKSKIKQSTNKKDSSLVQPPESPIKKLSDDNKYKKQQQLNMKLSKMGMSLQQYEIYLKKKSSLNFKPKNTNNLQKISEDQEDGTNFKLIKVKQDKSNLKKVSQKKQPDMKNKKNKKQQSQQLSSSLQDDSDIKKGKNKKKIKKNDSQSSNNNKKNKKKNKQQPQSSQQQKKIQLSEQQYNHKKIINNTKKKINKKNKKQSQEQDQSSSQQQPNYKKKKNKLKKKVFKEQSSDSQIQKRKKNKKNIKKKNKKPSSSSSDASSSSNQSSQQEEKNKKNKIEKKRYKDDEPTIKKKTIFQKLKIQVETVQEPLLDQFLGKHFEKINKMYLKTLTIQRQQLYRKLLNQLTFTLLIAYEDKKKIGMCIAYHDRTKQDVRRFVLSHIGIYNYSARQLFDLVMSICGFIFKKDPTDEVQFNFKFDQDDLQQLQMGKEFNQKFQKHGIIFQRKLQDNKYQRKYVIKRPYNLKCEVRLGNQNKGNFSNLCNFSSSLIVSNLQLYQNKQQNQLKGVLFPQRQFSYSMMISQIFRSCLSPDEADLLKTKVKQYLKLKQLLQLVVLLQKKKIRLDQLRLSQFKNLSEVNMKLLSQGKQLIKIVKDSQNSINRIFLCQLNQNFKLPFNFQSTSLPLQYKQKIHHINYFRLSILGQNKVYTIKSNLYNAQMHVLPTQNQKFKIFLMSASQFNQIKNQNNLDLFMYVRVFLKNVKSHNLTSWKYIWLPEMATKGYWAIRQFKSFLDKDIYAYDSINISYKQFLPGSMIIQPDHKDLVITPPFIMGILNVALQQASEGSPLYIRLLDTDSLQAIQIEDKQR